MSRCLVTGAAGFIGSHLCEALLARGDSVLGVDSFSGYYEPARKRANLADALGGRTRVQAARPEPGRARSRPGEHRRRLPSGGSARRAAELERGLRPLLPVQHRRDTASARGAPARLRGAVRSRFFLGGLRQRRRTTRAGIRRPCAGLALRPDEDRLRAAPRRLSAGAQPLGGIASLLHGLRSAPAPGDGLRLLHPGGTVAETAAHPRGRPPDPGLHVRRRRGRAATIAAAKLGAEPVYDVSGGTNSTLLQAVAHIERLTGRRAVIRFSPSARGDAYRTAADLTAARRDLGYNPEVALGEGLASQVRAAMRERSELAEAVA